MTKEKIASCSFCVKDYDQVRKLISGVNLKPNITAYICDECISVCAEVMEDFFKRNPLT